MTLLRLAVACYAQALILALLLALSALRLMRPWMPYLKPAI